MFKIQTLRSNENSLSQVGDVLLQAVPYIISFIGNLFGSPQRRELTSSDWTYLVPFHGSLYDALRSNLSARIKYDVDLPNLAIFTLAFAVTNGSNFGFPNTDQGHQAFYNELAKERTANGVPYINVNVPSNMVLPSDVSSYDMKYITNFPMYFYGSGSQQGTQTPLDQNGNPISTNKLLSGFGSNNLDLTTILIIGAGLYFVFNAGKSKGK